MDTDDENDVLYDLSLSTESYVSRGFYVLQKLLNKLEKVYSPEQRKDNNRFQIYVKICKFVGENQLNRLDQLNKETLNFSNYLKTNMQFCLLRKSINKFIVAEKIIKKKQSSMPKLVEQFFENENKDLSCKFLCSNRRKCINYANHMEKHDLKAKMTWKINFIELINAVQKLTKRNIISAFLYAINAILSEEIHDLEEKGLSKAYEFKKSSVCIIFDQLEHKWINSWYYVDACNLLKNLLFVIFPLFIDTILVVLPKNLNLYSWRMIFSCFNINSALNGLKSNVFIKEDFDRFFSMRKLQLFERSVNFIFFIHKEYLCYKKKEIDKKKSVEAIKLLKNFENFIFNKNDDFLLIDVGTNATKTSSCSVDSQFINKYWNLAEQKINHGVNSREMSILKNIPYESLT